MARTPRPRVIRASGGGFERTTNQTDVKVDPTAIINLFRNRNLTRAQEEEARLAEEERLSGFEALARVSQGAFGTVPTGGVVGEAPAPTLLEGLAPTPGGAAAGAAGGGITDILGQLAGTPTTQPKFDISTLAQAFGTEKAGPFITQAAETILPTGADKALSKDVLSELSRIGDINLPVGTTGRELATLISGRLPSEERGISQVFSTTEQEEIGIPEAFAGATFNQLQSIGFNLNNLKDADVNAARVKREAAERGVDLTTNLRKEYNGHQVVKEFVDTGRKMDIMENAWITAQELELLPEGDERKNFLAIDQALITMFNKLTDPSSVVRESEYARTASDTALLNRAKGAALKILRGGAGITLEDRRAIITMSRKFFEVSNSKFKTTTDFYKDIAVASGLQPNQIIEREFEIETLEAERKALERKKEEAARKAALKRELSR